MFVEVSPSSKLSSFAKGITPKFAVEICSITFLNLGDTRIIFEEYPSKKATNFEFFAKTFSNLEKC